MDSNVIKIFLCGDVMIGRGIDQILSTPSVPDLYESYMTSATGYIELAERLHGPLPRKVSSDYIWGQALEELQRRRPDCEIVNLETSITTSEKWIRKGINYRMHPQNIPCLKAAQIDCCVLANNHVLDWGEEGLKETLSVLRNAGLAITGAGKNISEASTPATIPVKSRGRVIVLSVGLPTSGVPESWAATPHRAGVNFIEDLSANSLEKIRHQLQGKRQKNDVVVLSIHWGENWGYAITQEQRHFAKALIDSGDVDIIHGHSSHHAKGIEVYKNKLILYGCGDFINDYEGIGGYEAYRGDLAVMYFVTVSAENGELQNLELVPLQIKRFQLQRASHKDLEWLAEVLKRQGRSLGTSLDIRENILALNWGISQAPSHPELF